MRNRQKSAHMSLNSLLTRRTLVVDMYERETANATLPARNHDISVLDLDALE